jgi:hypothetical protein
VASSTKFPGTTANVAYGSQPWTSTDNVMADDGAYANAGYTGAGSALTYFIKASNFGFAIPAGSRIDGIEVSIERKASHNGASQYVNDAVVLLNCSGGDSSDKADLSTKYPTSDTPRNYGGATDKWTRTWTTAEINASSFALYFACAIVANSVMVNVWVDYVVVTVYYSNRLTFCGVASCTFDGVETSYYDGMAN